MISFDEPGSDYLTDELADLTIRCMNYIDSANLLTGIGGGYPDRKADCPQRKS